MHTKHFFRQRHDENSSRSVGRQRTVNVRRERGGSECAWWYGVYSPRGQPRADPKIWSLSSRWWHVTAVWWGGPASRSVTPRGPRHTLGPRGMDLRLVRLLIILQIFEFKQVPPLRMILLVSTFEPQNVVALRRHVVLPRGAQMPSIAQKRKISKQFWKKNS